MIGITCFTVCFIHKRPLGGYSITYNYYMVGNGCCFSAKEYVNSNISIMTCTFLFGCIVYCCKHTDDLFYKAGTPANLQTNNDWFSNDNMAFRIMKLYYTILISTVWF